MCKLSNTNNANAANEYLMLKKIEKCTYNWFSKLYNDICTGAIEAVG